MNRRTLLLLSLPLTALSVRPAQSGAADAAPHPLLVKAGETLRNALARELPQLSIRIIGNRLSAESGVRSFQVYPSGPAGEAAEKAVERRGPGKEGILLTLEIMLGGAADEGDSGFAREYSAPYWNTLSDQYLLQGGRERLRLTLQSGPRVTARLLEAVRKAVATALPAAVPAPEHPVLRKIGARFQEVLGKRCPDARIRSAGRSLHAEYRVRPFQVYGRLLTGEFVEEPHAELGPDAEGFQLSLTVQDGPYEGMAVVPQEIQYPYWSTYLNAVNLPASREHLFYTVSTGARPDRELIPALIAAIRAD